MPKKKLSRDQKRKQKRRGRQKQGIVKADPNQTMIHRLKKAGLGQHKFIHNPAGVAKMSDVLLEFIEPYKQFADDTDAMHRLIATALVAWNTTLLPESEQAAVLKKTAQNLPANAVEDFYAIVQEMMQRKNRYFADYTRHILDYELTDLGHSYHISVVSTMEPQDEETGE